MNLDHLSNVISHVMAPAFLIGAVAGFVAVLMGRMNGIIDRIRAVNGIAAGDEARTHLKSDLPRLKRRAKLMNDAIYFAVGSALCTTLLVILAFVSAFFGFRHEPGVAVVFVLALGLLGASLLTLAREVRVALNEFDHHG
jgi:cytochrome c biogenesis protein CcdA